MAVRSVLRFRHVTSFTAGTLLGCGAASLAHARGCPICAISPENQKLPATTSGLASFSDALRGVSRFCDCGVAFIQVAVDYKFSLFNKDVNSESYAELKSKIHERSAILLREMCCRNGGVFIKVAQHLGSLDYLLPAEYVQVMKVLHSRAPFSPIEDVRSVLQSETGQRFDEMFSDFNPVPVGAASLAQAHKARLRLTGEEVVVKVQHKNVKKFAYLDMRTMEFLVGVAEKFFPEFRFRWLVEITKKNLPLELDFLHEADNCERAEKTYAHMKDFLKLPKIYRDFSTSRVLTMEFCEGCQVDDLAYMERENIDPRKVVSMLGRLYSDMIFTRGYMHCDPHPGNLLVQKNFKTGNIKLVLLDHGLYQQLTDQFREEYCRLWLGLISGDVNAIRKSAEAMGTPESAELFACVVAGRSWDSVSQGHVAVKLKTTEEDSEIQMWAVKVVPQLTGLLDRVPRQLLLILKTNDLIRGIQAKLGCPSELSAFLAQSRACFWSLARADMARCGRLNLWCRLKVAASLMTRLLQVKLVEYAFTLSSLFHRLWLLKPEHPHALLRQIKA